MELRQQNREYDWIDSQRSWDARPQRLGDACDSNNHPISDQIGYSNRYANSDSYADKNREPDRNPNRDAHRDPHSHPNSDIDSQSNSVT